MIYSKCAVCRAAVHRYRASRPRRGEIANAGQDGLAVEAVHAAVSYGELAARWRPDGANFEPGSWTC